MVHGHLLVRVQLERTGRRDLGQIEEEGVKLLLVGCGEGCADSLVEQVLTEAPFVEVGSEALHGSVSFGLPDGLRLWLHLGDTHPSIVPDPQPGKR